MTPVSSTVQNLLNTPETRKMTFIILVMVNLIFAGICLHTVYKTKAVEKEVIALTHENQNALESIKDQNLTQQTLSQTIISQLASRGDLNGLILSLESTAPAHNVTLADGKQTYVPQSKTKLSHSLIQYSVQGSYASVMQFIAESLNKHNALVLKKLSFRRMDPLVSNLQIHIELALYYQ